MSNSGAKSDMSAPSLLRSKLDNLLESRIPPKTFCPSEVPRSLNADQLRDLGASSWRDLMDDTRELVWELRDEGKVDILQKGEVLREDVGIQDVKGPIRARRKLSKRG